jgi:alpha-ketoglutarate-dependent taurine dioxygenase
MAPAAPAAVRPLGATFGRVVEAAPGGRLADLGRAEVEALFREHGALHFVGFGATLDEFLAFSDSLTREFSTYRDGFFHDRQKVGSHDTLLTVTGSQESFAIPLHGEMYYTARQPDLLWFYCRQPAARGGETTLCDGEEIYRRLSPRARALLEGQRVRYRRALPDGGVAAEHLAWAIVPGRSGRRDTFINNVVALYLGELSFKRGTLAATVRSLAPERFPITVRMEDGSPIPGAVVKEILAENQRAAVAVRWREGEVLMVDNTRILHGRLAHSGERHVYVRLGDRAF